MEKFKYQQLSREHRKMVHQNMAAGSVPCHSCQHNTYPDRPMCAICHNNDKYEPNFLPSDTQPMVEYLWKKYYAKDEELDAFFSGTAAVDALGMGDMTDLANDFLGQVIAALAPK